MTESVLVGSDLVVTRSGEQILDGVSLSVASNATVLVQGPSGAGKTTLFNVLGLLEAPESGTLHVDGRDASALSERERAALRRSTIGFVFQDFQLIGDLTARENAALPQEHAGEPDPEWLDTLFDRLGIAALGGQYPATLSGGEKQRVAIARALANRPEIVLADEPTGQLDPATADAVLDLLFGMQASAETALIVISHDPQLAPHFDERLQLADGRLVEHEHNDEQPPQTPSSETS
ncbi:MULTISPECIES: ABC transporter ATP-binding protein [Halomicrobium]|uniref:ABC transporter related n=2 Tax=Halomicrobium mukohataei TaxID=57705 RepID=C7NVU6_HALMD|nr:MULTISPECIES: ABC transporter ATP-binding protein [Halomicrobium]ACV46211.1 ABC transporter related [Halomicrobium mukohataei DSM 12286]QCD64775.1 ABC transporter ATP-binding protein [Halomicrobium mukohataei]QFR19582.1 ATP-binding cassette domain-containing protein [Halomicrobium sp. ZPS1]